MPDWLSVTRGPAPLIISMPHAGQQIPPEIEAKLISPAEARWDADHHIPLLYGSAAELGATVVRTEISRTVIDVNRDPSGVSLYPGQATTGLCPATRFNGDALHHEGQEPNEAEIARRRALYFAPYHAALAEEIVRLKALHGRVVLYDAHSILSRVPRLFEGELPQFNIGTYDGASCDPALTVAIAAACDNPSKVINGRFKGGWITRHYGAPADGVHAIQMELAMRGYLDEDGPWPPLWQPARATGLQPALRQVLGACLTFSALRP